MTTNDAARADFEAFARSPHFGLSPGHFERGDDGQYLNVATEAYWLAFRAGRGSLVVELPPIEAWDNDGYLERERDDDASSRMALVALVDVRIALEAQGINVR